ncbi:hypothetical protein H6G41_34350 [Tolypothrix sp. FACHB-123]|uniref:hypothetical protein n=1 Tax=Tolypothrix sp. FACHB-123 TaxID=2692868 RepID=UPI001682B201|nr:hypothetical protein [Tolypothrix sp. FACHB-123]MBD2359562.1 hypothetical protein [Tolypothrix sp. FACHB-123]
MPNFRERMQSAVKLWQDNHKNQAYLFSQDYDRMLVYLWCHSRGGKKEGYSEDIAEFAAANRKAIGDVNYAKMLRVREYCDFCSETYKLENLSICIDCRNVYCYRCAANHGVCSNGNYSCVCGGDLVG